MFKFYGVEVFQRLTQLKITTFETRTLFKPKTRYSIAGKVMYFRTKEERDKQVASFERMNKITRDIEERQRAETLEQWYTIMRKQTGGD